MLQLRDPNAEFRVVSMMRLSEGGRWRTEVQRSHVRPVLLWFTRGQGRVTVGGGTRGYGPHNAVFIPGGTMHSFTMMGQVYGTAIFFPEDQAPALPDEPLHLRLRDGFQQAEISALVEAIDREAVGERPGAERAMRHWGGLIAVWLERHAELAEATPSISAGQRLMAAYSALVERDFRTGRGVQGYADRLGVTPTHLSRVCRESSGKSAHRILNERIHFEARRLLSESEIPVKDIATRLGFNSAAYFSRAFLHETGQSPTAFRRQS
ncbi:MAG: AraC family transcriptional regulator [Pseudomonadota bacterium]